MYVCGTLCDITHCSIMYLHMYITKIDQLEKSTLETDMKQMDTALQAPSEIALGCDLPVRHSKGQLLLTELLRHPVQLCIVVAGQKWSNEK